LKPTDERGFTLVEVLIATVILTVGLVSMAELLAISLRMQMLGRNDTAAIRLAQDKVDELMTANFDTALAIQIGGSLDDDVTNYNDTPAVNGFSTPGYKRRWTVAAGPADPGAVAADLRVLTVRVIPTTDDRRTSSPVELVTIIRRW